MIYTYKYDDEIDRFRVYTNGQEILTDKYLNDREDLLIELEKLEPGLLLINGRK